MTWGLLPLCCGAFIARSDGLRFNDALQFVVTRDGTHTTMAVSNRYRGPAEDFALLVPVPSVLHEGDVKVLDPRVLEQFELRTAPRLFELEERDPCEQDRDGAAGAGPPGGARGGVKIESQFVVGEYDVAVLSSTDSTTLLAWLKENRYVVPDTLATQLTPYITEGYKFFVAKVDMGRLRMRTGGTDLSALVFQYDEPELRLPLRLSAASSPGVQDVLVYALAKGKKLEAANRPNLDIPTGLDLNDDGATHFPEFYAALFQSVMAKTPTAVVTEYAGGAWQISTEALEAVNAKRGPDWSAGGKDWSVTRLHLQVDKAGKLDDLLLREAPLPTMDFAANYNHRTKWTGKVHCADPRFGRFANVPVAGNEFAHRATAAPAGVSYETYLAAKEDPKSSPASTKGDAKGCCETGGAPPAAPMALLAIGTLLGRLGSRGPRAPRRT